MLSKATIKDIQSLQHKKFRDERNEFIAEGPKVVKELLLSDVLQVMMIYALPEWINDIDHLLAEKTKNKVQEVTDFELEKIAGYSTPNQVVAVFQKKTVKSNFEITNNITLVLDDIQDPGNLGTIIRTADWFGITNIVCSKNTVDVYNSKVVQSTMASLARVNVFYTDLKEWLTQNNQVKILATLLKGKELKNYSGTKEAILLIGNEANGLSKELAELANDKITIPGFGEAESLNAAIATAIVLYELKR